MQYLLLWFSPFCFTWFFLQVLRVYCQVMRPCLPILSSYPASRVLIKRTLAPLGVSQLVIFTSPPVTSILWLSCELVNLLTAYFAYCERYHFQKLQAILKSRGAYSYHPGLAFYRHKRYNMGTINWRQRKGLIYKMEEADGRCSDSSSQLE